jgi:hypothetical protein
LSWEISGKLVRESKLNKGGIKEKKKRPRHLEKRESGLRKGTHDEEECMLAMQIWS